MKITCMGGCGLVVIDEGDGKEASAAGLSRLEITGRYRCGPCTRALEEAGRLKGVDVVSTDTLDPRSRGHIARETASSILPPARIQ